MAIHLAAQQHASLRNSLVETYTQYMFKIALEKCSDIEIIEIQAQKEFKTSDNSDVFDHYAKVLFKGAEILIWGQMTCYKGETKKAESNKTYEVRETLVESLNLRKWHILAGDEVRTFHITYGPPNYSYGWISSAKNASFDLSLYPTTEEFDFYSLLGGFNCDTQFEFFNSIEEEIKINKAFARYTNALLNLFQQWFKAGLPKNPSADMQANLLLDIMSNNIQVIKQEYEAEGIKPLVLKSIQTNTIPTKPHLQSTIEKTLATNPFLAESFKALSNWNLWCSKEFKICDLELDIHKYMFCIWNSEGPSRLVKRRLLLRILLDGDVKYLQDIGIDSVSEHNLYIKIFPSDVTEKIITYLVKLSSKLKIKTSAELHAEIISASANLILKNSFKLELKNGTNLKPSFYFVEASLSEKFIICSRNESDLSALIGFHGKFNNDNVSEYTNFKIIKSKKSGKTIAILKSKFFNKPEFPRRCKEEAYVGLTTLYDLTDGKFKLRNNDIPVVMFIDMDVSTSPPAYSLNLLGNWGWRYFFNIKSLVDYLTQLDGQ